MAVWGGFGLKFFSLSPENTSTAEFEMFDPSLPLEQNIARFANIAPCHSLLKSYNEC